MRWSIERDVRREMKEFEDEEEEDEEATEEADEDEDRFDAGNNESFSPSVFIPSTLTLLL
jgi:hypothetical protein